MDSVRYPTALSPIEMFSTSLNMQSLNSVGTSSTLLHHTSYNEERYRKEEYDHKKQVCLDWDYEVEFVASPDDSKNQTHENSRRPIPPPTFFHFELQAKHQQYLDYRKSGS